MSGKRALLIAEKPSLMRDIEKAYRKMSFPDDVSFMALRGHILELYSPGEYSSEWGTPWKMDVLPMIPARFQYKVINKKDSDGKVNDCRLLYKQVKEALTSNKYDYVINACDAGREGELIFYEIYKTTGCKLPVKRFWANSTTEEAYKKALNNLIDDKEKSLTCLKASAQYRAYFDWLLGMNLSRAFTLKVKSSIALGRVMTPTLAIIVERELEIRNFVPKDYWEIEVDFDKYKGKWFDPKTDETKFYDKEKAEKIVNSLSKKGKIDKLTKETEKKFAPTLHSLLELQREANRVFGYTADKTLKIAQVLYEEKKILTYPRTESRYLPTDMIKEIPQHLKVLEDIPDVKTVVANILANPKKMNSILSTNKYVDNSKLTDHHAIIPTDKKPDLSSLTKDEINIYMLVVKRFLAIFLDPYIVEKTTIITKVDGEHFKTTGRVIVDKGYMVLYKEEKENDALPKVNKDDEYPVVGLKLNTKQTEPPKRYTDDSLLSAMLNPGKFVDDEEMAKVLKETAGLGTSSTRGEIIKKLLRPSKNNPAMVELKGKHYYATDFGIQIIFALKGKDIISPELTAKWEVKLRAIEEQNYDIRTFYNEMIEYTKKVTNDFRDNITTTINNSDNFEIVGKCPICGADVKEGKEYYLCTKYKNPCTFVFGKTVLGVKLPKAEVKKLLEGKETKEFDFTLRSGQKVNDKLKVVNGKVVISSAEAKAKNKENESENPKEYETIGKCPKCGKNVINKVDFYVCEDYNNGCDFNMKKEIKKGKITVENMKDILTGDKTNWIDFEWGSGKQGKAKLYWDKNGKKLGWEFPP